MNKHDKIFFYNLVITGIVITLININVILTNTINPFLLIILPFNLIIYTYIFIVSMQNKTNIQTTEG
jgi:hypothetical protein